MKTLIEALEAALTGEIRLNSPVTAVSDHAVTLSGGEEVQGRGVVLAAPAWKARSLLGGYPAAAKQLGEFGANGSVAVVLAYRREQVRGDLAIHGILVDAREPTPLSAITLHSSKIAGRAPEGHVLLRAFFADMEPAQAEAAARREAARLLDITGEPLWSRVLDWRGQNPAYSLGHLERVAELERLLPPSVRLAGSSYGGVGIPDCVRYARQQAAKLASTLLDPTKTETLKVR
ncbi:protoporphyrinogen/coproporphyrinogen oxidase [Deinococcus lacus]|uniref:Protoporphyrinogen/coproporphyrinogen oxidase n=1 Tax=Deinococcus lacus TaxID=392561 RepID=A0ABW1YEG5_9DEIO